MKKLIAWENWNVKEKELADFQDVDIIEETDADPEEIMQMDNFLSPILGEMKPQVIQTPFGVVSFDSALKPSDRWDCWLGYTNFDITNKISDRIKIINGVEALRIMSRYTFCVGVGKMFQFSDVRKEIENAICKQ
jgi:hypothetical protein